MDKQPQTQEFDVIVVGSGPSGATIAKELSKRGKRVLILERGGGAPLKEEFRATRAIFGTVAVSDDLHASRAMTTGGTTSIYFAVAGLPPLETFRALGIDLSGPAEEVKKELPLTTLPDEMLGAQTIRARNSALELGYAWQKNLMLVDLSKCASGYRYEAKWNATSYLRQAVDHGANLVTRATVVRVLKDNGRAIGVEYQLEERKSQPELRRAIATRTVLAAGALASAGILRESGIKSVVNSGFYCGPSFVLFGMVPGQKAGDTFVGSMGAELGDELSVGDANLARTVYQMNMLGSRKLARTLFHSKSIAVGVKIRDGLGGGLQEDGRFHKSIKKEDLQKLEKGEQVARRILGNAGGKRIFKSVTRAGQLGGVIRINEHLDNNLETECRHLHVCDGSVIPAAVKVPPTLSLVCLAKYLANRLMPSL